MAMIDKIRKQKELLLIMIGLGMIGFLIPYDAVMALVGAGSNKPVGEINGTSISQQEYQLALRERKNLFSYSSDVSLKNDVWNDFVEREVLSGTYDQTGVTVSNEEFEEILFGDVLSPYVKSAFYGQDASPEAKATQRQNFSRMDPNTFASYQRIITERRKREKFDLLAKKGMYATSLEGKYDYHYAEDAASFDYVLKKYSEIPDSLVNLSDADVKSYYNRNKNNPEYKQDASRSIEFVSFSVEASEEDINSANEDLAKLREEWMSTANDSTFVMTHSKSGMTKIEYNDGDFAGKENEELAFGEVGTIVGPYVDGDILKLSKVISKETLPDTAASARHILIKADSPELMAGAKAKADSILKVIKRDNNFEDMVTQYSDDPGSKATGGLYEWFPKGRMVKPFEDACFKGKVGDISVVETQFGYHIIEVMDLRTSREATFIATIDRSLGASSNTIKNAYRNANEFSINNNTSDDFHSAADTMGYAIEERLDIKADATVLAGMQDAYEVISWAFRSNVGDISSPMLVDGDKYVIAHLTSIKEKGAPALIDVEDQMREAALIEKKADMYVKIMSEGSNLEEIANAAETQVKSANNVKLKSKNIPSTGVREVESEVIGLAFSIPQGEMSKAIKGKEGVYVIAPSEPILAAVDKTDYFEEQDKLLTGRQNGSSRLIFEAMKEKADVKDERGTN